ncbi:MAG: copper oxidase [Thermoanaerobaculia bacterium]
MTSRSPRGRLPVLTAATLLLATGVLLIASPAQATCNRQIKADVVALDQVYFWNRYGAVQPHGMIYALKRDVEPIDSSKGLEPGNVRLREDKRPRPLVLRMNEGDCLTVHFTNLLNPTPVDNEQPATRTASVHAIGMQLVDSIADDGSFVGANDSSLVAPGESASYTFYGEKEGGYLLYSGGAMLGGEGDSGSIAAGLFGSVNVQPKGAEWYRSQVTAEDMKLATVDHTAQGHPILDYDAVYPTGHRFEGLPILDMLQGHEIVHSDLTAIITGPNRGDFPKGTYRPNPVYPNRDQSFREYTIIFHDETGAVQAFPIFNDPVFEHTTHSGRDAFAINYGTGGIGAEILANRLGVGPVHECAGCKYEEFFLTSWAVGDPAMVVDVPANAPCTVEDVQSGDTSACSPDLGPKATKAFYPDDPSNVYHSYLSDHVKFRNLHAGSDDHHIFHLHAHQWLHTPNSDKSAYLDSQAIGQGSSFTYEATHNGSGNRNQTVGDSIFHCHFYPHFAQGMWSLWRVHDVFESGTPLDAEGRPADGSRALPDGEIAAGTPIPGVVPIPTRSMAPAPQADVKIVDGEAVVSGTGNPGYPFFIPGKAGHRPPHPPLDTLHDGGLPRHVLTTGETIHVETRLDFTKELEVAEAHELDENGEPVEVAAMDFHAQRWHESFLPDGSPGKFKANGLPPSKGAPYAEPCIDDAGNAVGSPRTYKAADIQLDAVLNKSGWHFPQQRIIALWDDVKPTLDGTRPPEPLFFRGNTDDCISYWLTNLVPNVYELDDFQVRTPTDILGQHIHLVKFDVTSSDGSANGFNYEDGSFSPDEVVERIHAINAAGGLELLDGTLAVLEPEAHPFFGSGPDANGDGEPDWLGAQTTIQRWYADDTLDLNGNDRTLRTVFTHDHFGPSTHQQAGLYAGLVVEPAGSKWLHNETGEPFYTRHDGGPTSWQAVIETESSDESYREFLLEFADFQLAYQEGSHPEVPFGAGPTAPKPWDGVARQPGEGFDRPDEAVNPPARVEVGLPFLYADPIDAGGCPGGVKPPCPELISSDDPGTYSVNYRNEPLASRLRDPATNEQAAGDAGDPSLAYSSKVKRVDPDLNVQPAFYPPLTGDVQDRDPYTPLLRTFLGDRVQIRILAGAHEEEHNFSIHGIKWLFEPSDPNSGYRNSQGLGISEHFEFIVPQFPGNFSGGSTADFLWKPGAAVGGQWNGLWGLLRSYTSDAADLVRLSSNPPRNDLPSGHNKFDGACPKKAPVRTYDVVAVTAADVLPHGTLIYNSRPDPVKNPDTGESHSGPLHDPTAILFVRASDLDSSTGKLKDGVPVEPLILRVAAGECLEVTLRNELPKTLPDLDGYNSFPNVIDKFNANQIRPSHRVGLHPQLLFYDISRDDGSAAGFNKDQTVLPGHKRTYRWFAGDVWVDKDTDSFQWAPVEYGTTGLTSSDPLKHSNKGALGALIVEPEGSKWEEDPKQRASAWGKSESTGLFRENVLIWQTDVNLRYGDGSAVKPAPENEDPAERGQKAFNYKTEPVWFRMGFAPETSLETTRNFDFTKALSNDLVGGDPETPVFTTKVGTPTRLRLTHPAGHGQMSVFELHGHIWQELPYVDGSSRLGSNPLSEWKGSLPYHGASNHYDVLLEHGAGGAFGVTGDYLYRDYPPWLTMQGLWGIFRVIP